jgi:LPXTG-site transpeptidase (sortase) family protein
MLFLIVIFLTSILAANASTNPTISISTLNISREIKEFPLRDGTWAIDPWETGIGHLEATGWFDNPTNIVLAGHSTMPNGSPGVFISLDQLAVGDEIVLSNGDGDRHYQVTDIRIVPIDDISVVMPTDQERLTLITCEVGSYHESSQQYLRRLVVIADRVY